METWKITKFVCAAAFMLLLNAVVYEAAFISAVPRWLFPAINFPFGTIYAWAYPDDIIPVESSETEVNEEGTSYTAKTEDARCYSVVVTISLLQSLLVFAALQWLQKRFSAARRHRRHRRRHRRRGQSSPGQDGQPPAANAGSGSGSAGGLGEKAA